MKNSIFMSIKEEHIERIAKRSKNHEFRNRIPKKEVEYIIVYVPTPVKKLKYILKVKEPVKAPNKIEIEGKGNQEFNDGKGSKYAYPIESVYKINEILDLGELKNKYNFTAPQSFAYGEKYKEILKFIEKVGTTKIY